MAAGIGDAVGPCTTIGAGAVIGAEDGLGTGGCATVGSGGPLDEGSGGCIGVGSGGCAGATMGGWSGAGADTCGGPADTLRHKKEGTESSGAGGAGLSVTGAGSLGVAAFKAA